MFSACSDGRESSKAEIPVEILSGTTEYRADYFSSDGQPVYSTVYIGDIGKVLFAVYYATKFASREGGADVEGANISLAVSGVPVCSVTKTPIEFEEVA